MLIEYFNPKVLIKNDFYKKEEAILTLLAIFGPQKFSFIRDFIQKSTIERKTKDSRSIIGSLYNKSLIYKDKNGELCLYLPDNALLMKKNFGTQCAACFIRYLLNLKDSSGRFIYYGAVNSIELINSFPDLYTFKINDVPYNLQYVPSFQIDEYNHLSMEYDKAYNIGDNDIYRILLSDDQLELSQVKANHVVNIAVFDNDFNITILK